MTRVWLAAALAALPCVAAQSADEKFFDTRVAPILTRRCLPCHNAQLNNGGISFEDCDTLLAGGSRGPAILPGDPAKSILIQALRHEGELQMPPGPPLPAKETRILTEWVRRGAVWGSRLRK